MKLETLAPMLGLLFAANVLAAEVRFSFEVPQAATTSAGVYSAEGRLVRVLWEGEKLPAGKQERGWDGMDQFGKPAPAGEYRFHVVYNSAQYVNVGAIGNSGLPPDAKNHTPTSILSVACDAQGNVYTANGWDEAGADFKRWDADGKSVYDAEYQMRNGHPNGAPYAICTDDEFIYCGMGGWADPNWKEAQQIQRFHLKDGKHEKFTGTGREDGHIQVYEWPSKQIPAGTSEADAELMKSPLRALAIHGDSIFCVDALGNRVLRFHKVTGQKQGEFPVKLPQALAIDGSGRLWVGHEHHRVTIFTPEGQAVGQPISDAGDVQSLAFDANGSLYLADSEEGHVRIFTVKETTVTPAGTFGQKAIPGDREPDRFFLLKGAAVDPSGNLFTIQNEPAGGARLAKWSPTQKLLWEQFGCEFVSLGNYGASDPDVFVSVTQHFYKLLDRAAGKWEYTGDGSVGPKKYTSDPHGVPRVLHQGNADFYYLPSGDGVQIYRIDGRTLRLCSMLGGRSPMPDGAHEGKQLGMWTWHDAAGHGEPKPDEIQWFKQPGEAHYDTFGMDVDADGNIFFANHVTQSIWTIPHGQADAHGNPTYDWKDAKEFIPRDHEIEFQPNMAQHADDGSVYAFGWSKPWPSPKDNPFWMGGSTLVRFDKSHKLLWAVPLRQTCVGLDVLPGGGCVVGQGKDAILDHYTSDGLRVGSMQPGAAMSKHSGWLDNHSSVAVNRDPRDHQIDVFAEDDYVLRIGWYRFDDAKIHTIEGTVQVK